MTLSSCSAIASPIVMPPMNCERAVRRVDDAPGGEHAEHARDADLAGVGVDAHLGELRAEGVAREARASAPVTSVGRCRRGHLAAAAELLAQRAAGRDDADAPRGGARSSRRRRGARGQRAVADLDARRARAATPSASAAICVSAVRAPVPMSAAAMRTTKLPSARRRAIAVATAAGRRGRSRRRRPCRCSQRAVAARARRRVAVAPSRSARRPRAGTRRGCAS